MQNHNLIVPYQSFHPYILIWNFKMSTFQKKIQEIEQKIRNQHNCQIFENTHIINGQLNNALKKIGKLISYESRHQLEEVISDHITRDHIERTVHQALSKISVVLDKMGN